MPPTTPIAPDVLNQHIAVLGKTGSGKTSTAKHLIELVVAAGHRVCILDPIKSDWWGLTSSADGRRPGLDFSILGGPRGHVALHSSAGKAVAELVAGGGVPLAIVDMADFEPGGQARFFVDFAPTLLRKMRGVVYLVIEEAHLFAPKERSGIGAENLAIHWAKTLATAGRSKGIRLVLVTQRTQALHNALLGSCDTVIAHRLTAPADQEPVLKWLKGNANKTVLDEVTGTLASLPTGTGLVCSGEARYFEAVPFPRIATFDNTATPTGDSQAHDVMTARVDRDRLRAMIGAAVEEAEANDPRALRKRIADLEQQLTDRPTPDALEIEVPVLSQRDIDFAHKVVDDVGLYVRDLNTVRDTLAAALDRVVAVRDSPTERPTPQPERRPRHDEPAGSPGRPSSPPARPAGGSGELSRLHRAFLTALAQHGQLAKGKILIYTGYRSSGDTSKGFAALVQRGWCESPEPGVLALTRTGRDVLGPVEPLPTGKALRDRVLSEAGGLKPVERAFLSVLFQSYPKDVAKSDILERAGYRSSGDTSKAFAHLVGLDYAVASGVSRLKAADVFYEGTR